MDSKISKKKWMNILLKWNIYKKKLKKKKEDMKLKKQNISIEFHFYKLIPNNIIKSKKRTNMWNICNVKIIREKEKRI